MKPKLLTTENTFYLSHMASDEDSGTGFNLYCVPATEVSPARYTIELVNNEGLPLYVLPCAFDLFSSQAFSESRSVLEWLETVAQRVQVSASTPEQAFVKLVQTLSFKHIAGLVRFNNYGIGSDLTMYPHHAPAQWIFDVSREWCYEQFGQTAPVLEEEALVSTSHVRRKSPGMV